jgi:hypothetical protein
MIQSRLNMHWSSIGSRLDFHWTTIEHALVFHWFTIGLSAKGVGDPYALNRKLHRTLCRVSGLDSTEIGNRKFQLDSEFHSCCSRCQGVLPNWIIEMSQNFNTSDGLESAFSLDQVRSRRDYDHPSPRLRAERYPGLMPLVNRLTLKGLHVRHVREIDRS